VNDDNLSITLVNDPAAVRPVMEQVQTFCRERNVPDSQAHKFGVALDEALTNIVSYAFGDGKTHRIEVKVERRSGDLIASISDDGAPFDPLAHPVPDVRAPLEQRRTGGLGIHLMRELTDTIAYRRDGDRNRLTFSVCGAKPPSAE
jgi:serine/threonine-protein kinase RsbW